MMRKLLPTLGIAACVLLAPTKVMAEHFEVFILSGQSNAVGAGSDAAFLEGINLDPEVELFHSISTNEDFFSQEKKTHFLDSSWEKLDAQQDEAFFHSLSGSGFGAEIGLGQKLAENNPHHVAIIKFAVNGTQMGDPNGNGWQPGGTLHNHLLNFIDQATESLNARGDTFEFSGMFWMQGESDALQGRQANALDYEADLTNFISSLRSHTDNDSLPFILGQISPPPVSPFDPFLEFEYADIVRQAQAKVANSDPYTALVNTDALARVEKSPLPWIENDAVHFSSQGLLNLGHNFAEAYSQVKPTPAPTPVPEPSTTGAFGFVTALAFGIGKLRKN